MPNKAALLAELWLFETDDTSSTADKLPYMVADTSKEILFDNVDDVEHVCDAVDDITSTHSPQSDIVSFNQELHLFLVETLMAPVYYNPDDEDQKPVVLAAMGYGVPGFPDI